MELGIRPFISSLSEANDLFECEIYCRYYYYKNPFKCYRVLKECKTSWCASVKCILKVLYMKMLPMYSQYPLRHNGKRERERHFKDSSLNKS